MSQKKAIKKQVKKVNREIKLSNYSVRGLI